MMQLFHHHQTLSYTLCVPVRSYPTYERAQPQPNSYASPLLRVLRFSAREEEAMSLVCPSPAGTPSVGEEDIPKLVESHRGTVTILALSLARISKTLLLLCSAANLLLLLSAALAAAARKIK